MKIAVICPVKNEAQFIGFSIMAVWPFVEEFVYAVAPTSNDGTVDILRHIAKRYGKVRLLLQSKYDFDPHDTAAYNASFNDCIDQTRCDAVWFLHPDMIVTNPEVITGEWDDSLAWWTNLTSYAKDMNTVITKGRGSRWKNIHRTKFGIHYFGGYGSQNEDFYHSAITGTSHRHFGDDFLKYPYQVSNSGINVNHYCEVKPYARRLEKMKLCLKTQGVPDEALEEMAEQHPRVTLEQSSDRFGHFEFEQSEDPIPEVFSKFKDEFAPFQRTGELVYG